jgi:integrase
MLARQAKVLSGSQIRAALAYLSTTRNPVRNRAAFLLSARAGLRAKEIASLTWSMITDAEGKLTDAIRLPNSAAKGSTGGVIPMAKELAAELLALQIITQHPNGDAHIFQTERQPRTSRQAMVNLFGGWYRALGFDGCSSHSGRRTFITNAARNISRVGGSMRDVQALARHSSLATTQRYIEINGEAARLVVDLN